jgi:hypothetical protein
MIARCLEHHCLCWEGTARRDWIVSTTSKFYAGCHTLTIKTAGHLHHWRLRPHRAPYEAKDRQSHRRLSEFLALTNENEGHSSCMTLVLEDARQEPEEVADLNFIPHIYVGTSHRHLLLDPATLLMRTTSVCQRNGTTFDCHKIDRAFP